MKFQAKWFENNQEVELPEMKIEGSLAVAKLMKERVDDFLPFIVASQHEATLRLRAQVISDILASETLEDSQIGQLKTLCRIYNKSFTQGKEKDVCNELFPVISADLMKKADELAKLQIMSADFFLERSLIEAYYMMKAYIWEKAREKGTKAVMPFTLDDLKTLIDDPELTVFAKHFMEKIRGMSAKEKSKDLEDPDEEEIKKKLLTAPGK